MWSLNFTEGGFPPAAAAEAGNGCSVVSESAKVSSALQWAGGDQ